MAPPTDEQEHDAIHFAELCDDLAMLLPTSASLNATVRARMHVAVLLAEAAAASIRRGALPTDLINLVRGYRREPKRVSRPHLAPVFELRAEDTQAERPSRMPKPPGDS